MIRRRLKRFGKHYPSRNVPVFGERKYISQLVEKGWLSERDNPVQKWDRTKQYRVNIIKIAEDLLELGYFLQS